MENCSCRRSNEVEGSIYRHLSAKCSMSTFRIFWVDAKSCELRIFCIDLKNSKSGHATFLRLGDDIVLESMNLCMLEKSFYTSKQYLKIYKRFLITKFSKSVLTISSEWLNWSLSNFNHTLRIIFDLTSSTFWYEQLW